MWLLSPFSLRTTNWRSALVSARWDFSSVISSTIWVNVAAVAQSANAYTLHKDVLGADFAGEYARAGGGTVRNIDDSLMWAAGSRFGLDHGDAINGGGTVPSAVMMNNNAKCWLDRCEVDVPTGVYGFYVGPTAAVRTRNMAPNRTMNYAGGTVGVW